MKRPSLVGVVGVIGAIMVVFGLVRALVPAPEAEMAGAQLMIDAPATGDTVAAGPLVVRFQAGAGLRLEPNGWQADGLHLHAYLDGREHMPAAADITPAGPGTFEWRLPPLEPGEHTLSLAWSESMHSPVTEGASPIVRFVVR